MLSFKPAASWAARAPNSSALARGYLDALIVAGLLSLFLVTFVVRTFYIPSASMQPTLRRSDVLLVNEFAYRFHPPQRGDIIVFRPPIESSSDYIKRVIGIPGDTLRIAGGSVYVDGRPLREPYALQKPDYRLAVRNYGIYVDDGSGYTPLDPVQANVPPRDRWKSPDRIPDGFYFVMGDNRNDSEDSHIWGFAQTSGRFAAGPLAGTTATASVIGRAFLVLWPMNRMQVLN